MPIVLRPPIQNTVRLSYNHQQETSNLAYKLVEYVNIVAGDDSVNVRKP